ncbi:hypothetical protein CspeluHIS016_0406860 [Cutaneotrichosporon spelunceum]|uniref:Uncharacterized protein n=1 Tax=Cutaneotrichosporon spelunceum TaxID=1672016 RepID=A0AAD3TWT0_9TREE|nr:hypothetical protein CspeluHIS016_0406860 [Cutaneotrichosporon spelunceum]
MTRSPSTPLPTSLNCERHHSLSLPTLISTARTHLLLTPFNPTILVRVLSHLSPADQASVLGLNTAFYWLVLPLLSTHIVLSQAPWPRLRPLVKPPLELWEWIATHPPPSWVQQVDMYPHSSTRCMVHVYEHELDTEYAPRSANCPDRLPFLPRVQTLRIHGTLHTDAARWDGLTPQCSALQNVRPSKLVLLGSPTSGPLTSLPYGVLAAVDDYVLILSDPVEARAIVSDLTHTTARTATLIFAPPKPWLPMRSLNHGWPTFFAELGGQLAHLAIHVRIVNAGAIHHPIFGSEWDASRAEAHLETYLRQALRAEQTGYRPRGRPRCEVKFISMATYLVDAAQDELGAERLAEWRTGPESVTKGANTAPITAQACKPDNVFADAVGTRVADSVNGARGGETRE